MIVNGPNLQALFTGFETKWSQAYDNTPVWYNKLANEQPSSTEMMNYSWMARIATMREWVGERFMNNAEAYSTIVRNKDFELTEKLPRNKIEDDEYDIFATPVLQAMAAQAKKQPDYLIAQLIRDGGTTLTYDNQYLFDTVHPVDMRNSALGTQSNLFTSKALTFDNYATVRAAMRNFLGEDGKPLLINPNLLVVPPALEGMARQILMSDQIGVQTVNGATQVGGQTNIWKGSADLLVIEELSADPTAWYLYDVSKQIKPFVRQVRKAPEFTYLNNATDQNVFLRKEFLFGVDSREAVSPTLWFLGAKGIA